MLKTTHLYTNVKYLMLRSLIMKETNEHKVCSCCGKPHYAKGYCRNCYDRYHRTGNPEKQPTNKEKICSFCGKAPVYAKDLCKPCYARKLKKGTAEYRDSVFSGKSVGNYEFVKYVAKSKILVRCKKCGAERIAYPSSFTKNRNYRCKCSYKFRENLTERQKKYIQTFLDNECSYNETAKVLGVSKQAVYDQIKNLEAKNSPSVYLTGDIHGEVDRIVEYCENNELSSKDTVIILGDAGLNSNSILDDIRKKELSKSNVNILCIHGNHEIRPKNISSYKKRRWKGGTVWYEEQYPNILFAKDGEMYTIAGKTFFVLGGAYSVDKFYRTYSYLKNLRYFYNNDFKKVARIVLGQPCTDKQFKEADAVCCKYQNEAHWWADEQPSDVIKRHVERKICGVYSGKNFDFVLSHTCPEQYTPTEAFLPTIDQRTVDRSTEVWLSEISRIISYKNWYCGHWHINKDIDNFHFLYDKFVKVV